MNALQCSVTGTLRGLFECLHSVTVGCLATCKQRSAMPDMKDGHCTKKYFYIVCLIVFCVQGCSCVPLCQKPWALTSPGISCTLHSRHTTGVEWQNIETHKAVYIWRMTLAMFMSRNQMNCFSLLCVPFVLRSCYLESRCITPALQHRSYTMYHHV